MRNLEATKVKKGGSEKKKKQTGTHTIFPLLEKSAACAKLFSANSIDFLLFSLLSLFSITLFYFLFELTIGMLRRASLLVLANYIT